MNRKTGFHILLMIILISLPMKITAYQRGYQRQTDEIYALARHDLAVYYSESEEDFMEYIPPFTGIKVIEDYDTFRLIEYTVQNRTKTGWITIGDFYSDCLIYDGREKKPIADGDYMIIFQKSLPDKPGIMAGSLKRQDANPLLSATFTCAGNDSYYIQHKGSGKYLNVFYGKTAKKASVSWGSKSKAALFTIIRNDDSIRILESNTGKYLSPGKKHLLELVSRTDYDIRLLRTEGTITEEPELRLFAQHDAEWAKDYYGKGKNEDPMSNNFCTSGCGIFAALNAVYALTGQYIDPHLLADYAVNKGYRIENNGTDSAYFHAAARKFGPTYGFCYDRSSGTVGSLKKKIQKGDVAIAHIPGHYITIIDYDENKDRFLIMDPHYLPKRNTSPYGDWIPSAALEEEGSLLGYMYFYYNPMHF